MAMFQVLKLIWVQYHDFLYLSISIVTLTLGVIGYNNFLEIDYFNLPKGTYNTFSGYTLGAFKWLLISTWLLPVGLIFFIIFLFQFNKREWWHEYVKFIVNALLLTVCLLSCIYSYYKAESILGCGLFCWGDNFTPSSKPNQPYNATGQTLVFTIYFFVTLILSLFLTALCFRQLISFSRRRQDGSMSATPSRNSQSSGQNDGTLTLATHSEDSEKLLSSSDGNLYDKDVVSSLLLDANIHDTTTVAQKRLPGDLPNRVSSTRRAGGTSPSVVLVLVFGVLYPLIILGCFSLPTSLKYYAKNEPATTISYFKYEPNMTLTGFFWRIPINFQVGGNDNYVNISSDYSIDGGNSSSPTPITSNVVQGTLKIFPDIVMYYGTIYLISMLALLAQVYRPLSRAFAYRLSLKPIQCLLPTMITRVFPIGVSASLGEILLGAVFITLVTAEFCYWYFSHGWHDRAKDTYTSEERAARSMGQVLNVIVGLLLLPLSRNSVWTVVFGVSWESMVNFHTWMGSLLLICIVCHIGLFWKMMDQKGNFPHDIFCVPTQYHSNNFTIPLTTLTTALVFLCVGALSLFPVRRYCYELFYWPHHVAVIMLLMMLWHATFSWYYITGGLVLWAVDHFIRLHRRVGLTASLMTADVICSADDASDSKARLLPAPPGSPSFLPTTSTIVHLCYQVHPPINLTKLVFDSLYYCSQEVLRIIERACGAPLTGDPDRSQEFEEAEFAFEPGQYVFVNVPSVSDLCWHPFSISSAPHDSLISHHIKCMGESEWTGRLAALIASKMQDVKNPYQVISQQSDQANQHQQLQQLPINLPINIDGPYGVPLRYELYENILLCAGGIGITPVHSLFRFLLHHWRLHRSSMAHIQSVRLVWATRSREEVRMFQDTWNKLSDTISMPSSTNYTSDAYTSRYVDGVFSVSIHITARRGDSFPQSELHAGANVNHTHEEGQEDHGSRNRVRIHHSEWRPDFAQEVARMKEKSKPIVLACGPRTLVDTVELACTREGVEFQKELFHF